jgi:hypothetical protein
MALSVLMWALMVHAVPAVSASTEVVHATIAIQIAEAVDSSTLEEQPALSFFQTRPLPQPRPVVQSEPFRTFQETASPVVPRAGP